MVGAVTGAYFSLAMVSIEACVTPALQIFTHAISRAIIFACLEFAAFSRILK